MKRYHYVGPKEFEHYAESNIVRTQVRSQHDVVAWFQQTHPRLKSYLEVTATYIVDTDGHVWVTDRCYEHIACARGRDVLAAGEITFEVEQQTVEVTSISNQSTGYCPEPSCWLAVCEALDAANISRPPSFTYAFDFRLCEVCHSINVIKEDNFTCEVCSTKLPSHWNFRQRL